MKVIVIEDELLTAKNMARILKQILPDIEISATLDSVEATVSYLNNHPAPDLFFMDIQLSDGSSFEIFDKIKIEQPVIFTTAYNEYAIRAFKVNSIDYLLKPVDKDQLKAALDKYQKIYKSQTSGNDLQDFIHAFRANNLPKYKERFLAHYKSGIVPVPANRVSHFVKDTVIYLVTVDNEKLVTDYNTIDEIEEVTDSQKFFRANRQTIIHIDQVDTYKKHDTGKIEVQLKCSPGTRVDVSREKATEFIHWLDN